MTTVVMQLSFRYCRLGLYPQQHLNLAYRSKSNIPDKNQVGRAIKKLNFENKYLFGDLLDRPGHIKKVAKRPSSQAKSETQPLDGIQSEIIWYQSIDQKPHTKLVGGVGNEPKLVTTKYFSHNDGAGPNLSDISEVDELTNIPKFVDSDKSDSVSSRHSKTFSEPKQSLLLPNIIIRNIQTFPFFNTLKTSEDALSHGDTVLHISRGEEKYFSYPSVTKILNATMSDASLAALAKWKQKMVAALGEEGFLLYQDGLLRKGAEFHRTIYDHLSGVPTDKLEIDPDINGSWHSLSSVIPAISHVKVLESHVVHPKLMYRGVIDCVAEYKGKLAVIEWKKSDKQKRQLANTYDAPLQLAAYLGAMNYDVNYPFQALHGAVVVAYTDGSAANVFSLQKNDCAHYWTLWLRRLQLYWQKQVPSDQQAN